MIKQIFIHLGDRHTDGITLQNALVRGDITCPTVQVFYPTNSNHAPLAKTLSMKPLFDQRELRFSKLAQRIARSDADIAVISAEQFEAADPALLKNTLAQHFPDLARNIRLIAYVRPHGDRLLAAYVEAVTLGQFGGDLHSFHTRRLEQKPLHYTARFNHWRDVFGAAFSLRVFKGGDIVQDFAQFLLEGISHSVAHRAKGNPSAPLALSLQDLAMLRHLQSGIKERADVSKFQIGMGKTLIPLLAEARDPAQKPIPLTLHAELATAVKEAYQDDAQALDAAFFAPSTPMQDALQTACDTALAVPQSIAVEDHLSAAAKRMVDVWVGLLCTQSTTNGIALHEILKNGPEAAENIKNSGTKLKRADRKKNAANF